MLQNLTAQGLNGILLVPSGDMPSIQPFQKSFFDEEKFEFEVVHKFEAENEAQPKFKIQPLFLSLSLSPFF